MPQRRYVKFRDLWGVTKRQQLLEQLTQDSESLYQEVTPAIALGLPLKPRKFNASYPDYPLLTNLFPAFFPGVTTSRDDLVIDVDKEMLIERMKQYFDPSISNDEICRNTPKAMQKIAGFDPEKIRSYLCKRGFLPEKVVKYCYRPFDLRWLYWEPETNLLDRKRESYFPHIYDGNLWIEARQKQAMENFDRGYVVKVLADCFGNGRSSFFPLYLIVDHQQKSLFEDVESVSRKLNLSDEAKKYIDKLKSSEAEIFYHTISILHSPAYRAENAGALKQDFPRIPLPNRRETLIASANLGRQIAALLDPETPVTGITSGKIRPELKTIAVVSRIGTGNLDPNTDFALTAGWGYSGQNSVTMPGRGKVSDRPYTPEEQTAIAAVIEQLGTATHDIYLNDIAYWKNIPDRVWSYTIGGYQVIKKWLSYRELELLGRLLKQGEVMEVTQMARRIAAILLLEPELDANYEAVKQATYPWPVQQ
jgi:Type ISP C-terminal specificity domain